jgi:hypothetical protein
MIIAVIFILLIIIGIGLPLVLLILPKQNFAITLGVSYPVGIGVFTLAMFLTNIAGLRFSLLNEFFLLLLISTPLILLRRREMKGFFTMASLAIRKTKLLPVEKAMLAIVAFLLASSFINTLYWPVHIWDSVVLYNFRGYVFALTGFMKDALINEYYYSYPLLTSLAHSIVYITGGEYPQFLHSLFYLSLGVAFYGFLREFTTRKTGIFFTLILLAAQPLFYHSMLSLTNLPFFVYLSLGAISVFLWDKKKKVGYLVLSSLLVGLSTWTRSVEPFWLAMLLIVSVVSIYRKKIWNVVIFSLISVPIYEAWKMFQASVAGKQVLTAGAGDGYVKILPALLDASRWIKIFGFLYKHVTTPWGAIFIAFVLAAILVFLFKALRKYFLIFLVTIAMLAVLVAGTFIFSLYVGNWFAIGDATERLSMLFYPLFVFCVAIVVQDLVKMKR